MNKNKKSQITAFIIIGIILLFSTALVVYIKNKVSESETSLKFVTEEVPTWAAPVKEFTESCLKDTTKEALLILGQHGGYIYTENLIADPIEPTDSNSIEFLPNSNITIPYWWYLKSKNKNPSYQFSSEKPALYKSSINDDSIESQIERYIKENIKSCLNNYRSFNEQGFKITQGNLTPTVKITKNDIQVYLIYPVDIEKGDAKLEVSKYYTYLDLNFRRIYQVASSISDLQKNLTFFEKNTLDLIAVFSTWEDNNKLPPMSGTDFSKTQKIWMKSEVDKRLRQILMSYTPLFQIAGSLNLVPIISQDKYEMSMLGVNMLLYADQEVSNLETSFVYLDWPIYTKITPSTGELIKPTPIGFNLGIFNFQMNNPFVYDVSYPVVVKLRDPNAFNGEGYDFMFALEANVRNNNFIILNDTTPAALLSKSEPSLFCDENQKNSGLVTIITKDAATKNALDDVDVYFCIPGTSGCSADSCSMGFTKSSDGTAILKSKFPIAMGNLVLSKQDYFTKTIPIFTSFNKSMNITVELYPKKTIEINVKKKMLDKSYDTEADPECNACDYCKIPSSWSFKNTATEIFNGEKVIISLERVKEKEYEEDYNAVGIYSLDEIEGISKNISLIPGKYIIKINSILTFALSPINNVTIPKFVEGANDDWYDYIGMGDPVCIDIPEIVFKDSLPTGGLDAGESYLWEITENDLYNSDKLTFYIVSPNITQFIEHKDLEQIDIADESKTYWSSLKPVFSR